MSKHDYTKFSKPVETEKQPEPIQIVEPEVKTIPGVVVECDLLRVRSHPHSSGVVLCTIERGTEVEVEDSGPENGFYRVCTAAGVEGYCAVPYIELKG
ncbi:SH3 domain-containing protein [Fibrobacter sp.]|uniref:SH3 domain-containing protein n=1 Tax=Fibrobacter sp. TaxID=35828 RepID=UPI00388D3719